MIHVFCPNLRVDGTTVGLLVVAIIPWLGTIFEALEFPGGWKISYRKLQETEVKARESGLISTPTEADAPLYLSLADRDPNLALAALRIEIEKRLRQLAQKYSVPEADRGIPQLLRGLSGTGAISDHVRSVLSDLITTLNRAVHGASVEPAAARWAAEVGPGILAALDDRLK